MVCLHIDRLIQTSSGHLRKIHTKIRFDMPLDLPILTANTLCDHVSYLPIAALAHQGDTRQGHYQALLKAQTVIEAHCVPQWLHCDDCRCPRRCDQPPLGFEDTVTLLWLARQDVVELHTLATPHMPQVTPADDDSATLAMLNAAPVC